MHFFQYIELYTAEAAEVSLKNYVLVICNLLGPTSEHMHVRAVVDLSSGKIPAGSHYALVTNDAQLQSTVPRFPSLNVWRIFGQQINGNNFLSIDEENVVAVFLLYKAGDENLFELFKKDGKYVVLDQERLAFVSKYLLDFIIVRHAMGPSSCGIITDVFSRIGGPKRKILDNYLPEHTPRQGSSQPSLSINRCGNEQIFDIRAYKHGSR